jgi:hypothetical protein
MTRTHIAGLGATCALLRVDHSICIPSQIGYIALLPMELKENDTNFKIMGSVFSSKNYEE